METTRLEVVEQMQKRDRRGRRITSAERKALLLEAYEHSGMTQARFAREHGIIYQTFVAWVQKRRRQRAAELPAKPEHFIQVHPADAPGHSSIAPSGTPAPHDKAVLRARFADGLEVSSCDAAALAALIKALRS